MKFLNSKVLFLLVFTAILFASCANEGSFEPREKTSPISQITYSPTIWNANNPYDSIGYYHNEMLDYLAINRSELDETDYETFKSSLGRIVSEYISYNLGQTVSGSSLVSGALETFASFENMTSIPDWVNQTFTDTAVANRINNITDQIYSLAANASVPTIIASIKNIEDEVSNSNLTSSQKEAVFIYSSVSKFSLYYWTETLNDPNSEWREWWSENNPNETWPEPTDGIFIASVVADAVGAVAGVAHDDAWYECAGRAVVSSVFAELGIASTIAGDILNAIGAGIGFLISIFGEIL